jgi:hypothetical protein
MRKIPTIFLRDFANNPKYVTEEPNPECAWVFAGEGVATRKYDGTCVMLDGAGWWARREVKPGKPEPYDYWEIESDPITGKKVGWEPIEQSPFAEYHYEALRYQNSTGVSGWPKGTYELVGPKINGNPEHAAQHQLWAHAAAEVIGYEYPIELTYDGILAVLATHRRIGAEGIVWHHPDGRMAKIKCRDFPAVS